MNRNYRFIGFNHSCHLSFCVLFMTFVIVLFSCVSGCTKKETKIPLIGVILKDNNSSYFQDMEMGARKAANEGKAEIIVLAPEKRNALKQAQLLNDMIDMKVDALCIASENAENCILGIARATAFKIPVILIESDINRDRASKYDAKILGIVMKDSYQGGEMAAKYIAKRISGSGKIAVIEGVPKSPNGIIRRNGFLNIIKGYSNIQIIFTKPGYYKRSNAFDIGLSLIKNYPDLKGVFAFTDLMAIGVADSLTISRSEGKYIIVGYDTSEEGVRAIREGRIDASVYNNPAKIGEFGVKYAIMASKGEKIPETTTIKPEFITKDRLFLPFE